MAITVNVAAEVKSIDTLLVVGINRSSPEATADELQRLLDTHAVSQGFAFVPQGTPTNNTDTVESGWTRLNREAASIEAQREREIVGRPTAQGEPDEKDPDEKALSMRASDNAARLGMAFGLADTSTLRRQPFGDDQEWQRSRAMRTLLFGPVLGNYVSELISSAGAPVMNATQLAGLRTWFLHNVTGGAPLPTVRVGHQPYGVLPVLHGSAEHIGSPTAHRVSAIVDQLRDEWSRSFADGVLRLDHNSGDGAGDGTGDDEDGAAGGLAGDIAGVLAGEPHPIDFSVRTLTLHDRVDSDFTRIGSGLPLVNVIEGQRTFDLDRITWTDVDNGFVGEFVEDREKLRNDTPLMHDELEAILAVLGEPATVPAAVGAVVEVS